MIERERFKGTASFCFFPASCSLHVFWLHPRLLYAAKGAAEFTVTKCYHLDICSTIRCRRLFSLAWKPFTTCKCPVRGDGRFSGLHWLCIVFYLHLELACLEMHYWSPNTPRYLYRVREAKYSKYMEKYIYNQLFNKEKL